MRLVTADDVAAALSCCTRTVRDLEKRGELPVPRVMVGSMVRYDIDQLEEGLRQQQAARVRRALRAVRGGKR